MLRQQHKLPCQNTKITKIWHANKPNAKLQASSQPSALQHKLQHDRKHTHIPNELSFHVPMAHNYCALTMRRVSLQRSPLPSTTSTTSHNHITTDTILHSQRLIICLPAQQPPSVIVSMGTQNCVHLIQQAQFHSPQQFTPQNF